MIGTKLFWVYKAKLLSIEQKKSIVRRPWEKSSQSECNWCGV